MLRFGLSTIAAAMLAVAHPAFADSLAVPAYDSAQPAAATAEQFAPPAPAWSASWDAAAPVGLGWG
jgi:hypothetical protein